MENMSKKIKVYCCECGKEIEADIVGGDIIYPHRKDLYSKKFYLCPHCHNYAGVYQGESQLHGGVPIPSRKQVALVIRAMRMFHLIEYAANYDFPELQEPDNTAKFYPAIISICKFFRDAPLEVLEKYELEHMDD